jgi:hypothetical protein
MSFDLGVWHTPERLMDDKAAALYTALCGSQIDGVTRHPAVEAFYAELTCRYPVIDTVPDDRIDDHDYCPWSCALDSSPGHVLMACVWSQSRNVERFVRAIAAKYGLAVYDPQQGRITYPGGITAGSMDLQMESGRIIHGVTPDELASCLEGEEFAILSVAPDTYIQCAEQKEPPYEYVLDYQDGLLEEHYRATDAPITLQHVLSAFLKYLQGDASWRTDFRWEKMRL